MKQFGGRDVGFNNPGTLRAPGPNPDLSTASRHEAIELNLTSAWLSTKQQLPTVVKGGTGSRIFHSRVVETSAGTPGMGPYAERSPGVIALTQVLTSGYGVHGICMTAQLPGCVTTRINMGVSPCAGTDSDIVDQPLKRSGSSIRRRWKAQQRPRHSDVGVSVFLTRGGGVWRTVAGEGFEPPTFGL